jgi:hypothetical protein
VHTAQAAARASHNRYTVFEIYRHKMSCMKKALRTLRSQTANSTASLRAATPTHATKATPWN